MLNFFAKCARKWANKKQLELIAQYENFIWSRISEKIFYQDDKQDCYQFVCLELIKLFKNRYRYPSDADWKRVVLSMIERRTDHYRFVMLRESGRIISESRVLNDDDDQRSLEETVSNSVVHIKSYQDKFERIRNLVHADSKFTAWDRELADEMLDMYNRGESLCIERLGYFMGYSEEGQVKYEDNALSQFKVLFKKFCNKMRKDKELLEELF